MMDPHAYQALLGLLWGTIRLHHEPVRNVGGDNDEVRESPPSSLPSDGYYRNGPHRLPCGLALN